jgi:SET domain-containing protein
MNQPKLEVRQTEQKGRGVVALEPIAKGRRILAFQGRVLKTSELTDDLLAMQIGPDLWLGSDGTLLDDCVNHSCDPNAGFLDGEPVLHALRDIVAGEEIGWDYSTSIAEPGWTLECRCGAPNCRKIVQSWAELAAEDREKLRGVALRYLRNA